MKTKQKIKCRRERPSNSEKRGGGGGEERTRVRKIMIDKREGARESERDVRKVRKKHR
jgi:hypothetical protein